MTARPALDGARELASKRLLIRALLAPTDPVDAMTAYYALEHPAARVRLTLHRTPVGDVDGFVAVCQTGRDLFVPLVVLRATADGVRDLAHRALLPGRPYLVVGPTDLRHALEDVLDVRSSRLNVVCTLDAGSFRPVLNAMVEPGEAMYRHEIRVRGRTVAAAGVNWRTNTFAGIYVYASDEYVSRGWGRAVGAACIQQLLSDGLLPLYTSAETDGASRALAEELGFRDSAAREFECRASLRR